MIKENIGHCANVVKSILFKQNSINSVEGFEPPFYFHIIFFHRSCVLLSTVHTRSVFYSSPLAMSTWGFSTISSKDLFTPKVEPIRCNRLTILSSHPQSEALQASLFYSMLKRSQAQTYNTEPFFFFFFFAECQEYPQKYRSSRGCHLKLM